MLFRYELHEGQAALQSERVVLVFHGLSREQQRLFHFQGKQQAVQIAGDGVSSVSTCDRINSRPATVLIPYARTVYGAFDG
jgi:hypothetical protein